jgi:hypothetical protein
MIRMAITSPGENQLYRSAWIGPHLTHRCDPGMNLADVVQPGDGVEIRSCTHTRRDSFDHLGHHGIAFAQRDW